MFPSWVKAYLGEFFASAGGCRHLDESHCNCTHHAATDVRFLLELQVTDFSPTHIGAAAALLRGIGYPISLTIAPGLTLTPKLIFPYLATQLIMYAKTSGCMLSSFGFLKASMKVGSTAELAWNLV